MQYIDPDNVTSDDVEMFVAWLMETEPSDAMRDHYYATGELLSHEEAQQKWGGNE